jgi:hypothetical protein
MGVGSGPASRIGRIRSRGRCRGTPGLGMSICVYITRRSEPADENAVPISSAEWLAVASAEADFPEPTVAETEWSGPFMRVWMGSRSMRPWTRS